MEIIEQHFAAENAHDVAATLATYTEDVVWDDVGNPACPVHGKGAAAEMYEGIMDGIPDLRLESIGRFVCGDHVVDEAIATGHVRGSFIGVEGGGAPVRFRILHVFDIRDGLISREQAWFDTAGVVRQLESYARGAAAANPGSLRMTVQEWVDAYAEAWRNRDADAAASLFADDCMYREHPLQDPHRGAEGVRSYWANATATQDRVDVRMGRPVESSDGRRAAVEFWVRMLNSDTEVTLIGILFLRFTDDGRCAELRETWLFEAGDHAPHEGWGT